MTTPRFREWVQAVIVAGVVYGMIVLATVAFGGS
jgi:hypothetical protein